MSPNMNLYNSINPFLCVLHHISLVHPEKNDILSIYVLSSTFKKIIDEFLLGFYPKVNMMRIYISYCPFMKMVHFNHIYTHLKEHYQWINV